MPPPQLTFALNNPNAPNTVYVSTNPADNDLTLVLGTTVDISLTGGDVVPIQDASSSTGSLLYLDLTAFALTQAELEAISIATEGWTSTPYYSSSSQMIGFTPIAPISLSASNTIALSLAGFTLATQPSTPTVPLLVDYFRVTGISSGDIVRISSFAVGVTLPPDSHDKNLQDAIIATLSPAQVVNSPVGGSQLANALVLTLSPGHKPTPIKAVTGTVFTLTFVYAQDANGFGAMMTPQQVQTAAGFAVTPGQGVSAWTITPELAAQSPYWIFTPPVGEPILGTGVHSSISFDISGLVTNFQPGPTVVLLSYDNVPGYQSGTYAILAEKLPHVEITAFTATPETSTLQGGVAQVQLDWTASGATQLTLQPLGQDVTGTSSFTATITDTSQFSLIAEGQRPANIDNTAIATCTAYVMPVINDFTASPGAVYQGDFPTSVALAWNVDTGGQVNLTSSLTGADSNSYNAVGSVTKSLTAPQMLTLTPTQSSGFTNVSRSLIVTGFNPISAFKSNGLTGAGVDAPSNASFVAMAVPMSNTVAILSTATYQTLSSVSVGSTPLGLAFSPDGSTLYVANSGDGTVSVIAVTNTNSSAGYTFAVTKTIQVGGAPQGIAVGADGSAWVSIDKGSAYGALVKITSGAVAATFTTGVAPRGVAVTPSNGMVFVANSGSGSVTVVGNGATPVLRAAMMGLKQPVDVAISPDGANLLVADALASAVIMVNTTYYATSARKTYALTDPPAVIAAFPDGQYLAVGGAASTALLNYITGTSVATPLGGAAQGLGVTPDNGMAIISTAGQTGVTVVTYAQYAQVGTPVGFGGSVNAVAVTPDAANALVWANAGIQVQGTAPAIKGVEVYDVNNGVSTQILSGLSVSALVVSPGLGDNAFYLAEFKQSSIGVYSSPGGGLIASIPLPAKTGVANRSAVQLAISADGSRLFTLTNDGANTFSVVVFSADLTAKAFSVLADITVFVSPYPPLNFYLAAAPDGSAAYTVDPIGGVVYAVQESGGAWALGGATVTFPSDSAPFGLVVLPNGSSLYAFATNSGSNIVYTIDLASFAGVPTYLPDSAYNLAISAIVASPDSARLLAADMNFAGVRILDAASLRIVQTLSWQSGVTMPYGVAVSPDGSRIFCANARSSNLAIAEQVQPA